MTETQTRQIERNNAQDMTLIKFAQYGRASGFTLEDEGLPYVDIISKTTNAELGRVRYDGRVSIDYFDADIDRIILCDDLREFCERMDVEYIEVGYKAVIKNLREVAENFTTIADRLEGKVV